MPKRFLPSRTLSISLVLALSALVLALLPAQRQGAAMSPNVMPPLQKNLKERAEERDVEVSGEGSCGPSEFGDFNSLINEPKAIVHGRIMAARSFWDESGSYLEYGENITTEYEVEVLRVLKERIEHYLPLPGKPAPAPLATPLKIARHGGVVYVNGHRASQKVKGYESLNPGKQYLFFLSWSSEYQAYTLSGYISGAVLVNDDQSLTPLATSEEIREKFHSLGLQGFINELNRRASEEASPLFE